MRINHKIISPGFRNIKITDKRIKNVIKYFKGEITKVQLEKMERVPMFDYYLVRFIREAFYLGILK